MHKSLQVQCIDVIAVSRDNAWPQCTELVVIHAHMSDLLWSAIQLNSPGDSPYDSCLSDEGDSDRLEGPSLTGGLSTMV